MGGSFISSKIPPLFKIAIISAPDTLELAKEIEVHLESNFHFSTEIISPSIDIKERYGCFIKVEKQSGDLQVDVYPSYSRYVKISPYHYGVKDQEMLERMVFMYYGQWAEDILDNILDINKEIVKKAIEGS